MSIKLKKLNISLNHSDPQLFVTSQWQQDKNIPNRNFLIYRWIFALYFNTVVVVSLITAEDDGNLILYPIFLTNWYVVLNGVSSLLMAIVATQYFLKVSKSDNDLKNMTTALKASWLLSTLSAVIAVTMSITYWPLLYCGGRDKGINDVLTHAVNAIFLTMDMFINAHPPRYCHFIYSLLYGLTYALFSIIYPLLGGVNRTNDPYIYTVINWKYETSRAFLSASIPITFSIFVHCMLTSCIHLRLWMHKKLSDRECPKLAKDNDYGMNNAAYEA